MDWNPGRHSWLPQMSLHTAEFSPMMRMDFSSEGGSMVHVMRCASVVFICMSLQPSLLRSLSISTSRIAYRHTISAPISRA